MTYLTLKGHMVCIINCYWWHFVWWRQFSSYVTLFHNFRLACEVVPANMRSFARNDLQLKPSIWFIHFHSIHGIFLAFYLYLIHFHLIAWKSAIQSHFYCVSLSLPINWPYTLTVMLYESVCFASFFGCFESINV